MPQRIRTKSRWPCCSVTTSIPRAVRLHPLGGRRLETRYIWSVISRQRVSAGRYGSLTVCHGWREPNKCGGENSFHAAIRFL